MLCRRGIGISIYGLLTVGLAAGLLVPGSTDTLPCAGFEAQLQAAPSSLKRGESPKFTLVLRNTSAKPRRFLDARSGRRQSWGDTYYELVVRMADGGEPDISTVISDPGPISQTDYFALAPSKTASIEISTPLALNELPAGAYLAHVLVWVNPMDFSSICRSTSVPLRVR